MIFVLNNSRINLHRVNKRGKHHFRKQQMIFPENNIKQQRGENHK